MPTKYGKRTKVEKLTDEINKHGNEKGIGAGVSEMQRHGKTYQFVNIMQNGEMKHTGDQLFSMGASLGTGASERVWDEIRREENIDLPVSKSRRRRRR